ncbi:MAG: toxin TumE [bacterium]
MPLDALTDYLAKVETSLQTLKNCHFEKYEEEILTPNRANLHVRVRFSKGHLLELNEAVIIDSGKLEHLSYRYHFQDENNTLIFRYDNTPHFPDIETFPYHKHLPNQVTSTKKPKIPDVLQEVKDYFSSKP